MHDCSVDIFWWVGLLLIVLGDFDLRSFEDSLLILRVGIWGISGIQFGSIFVPTIVCNCEGYIFSQPQTDSLHLLLVFHDGLIQNYRFFPSHLDFGKGGFLTFRQISSNTGTVIKLNLPTLIHSGMSIHFIILLILI